MSKFKAGILGATTLSLGLFAATSAMATVITPFTWNPAGGGISTDGTLASQFTADNITIKDLALITIGANPSVPDSISESGTLVFTSFNLLSGTGAGFVPGTSVGASFGASPYQLYITFTSGSHLDPVIGSPGHFLGAFNSLSYQMWGDTGGLCTFSATAAPNCTGSGAQVELADGGLSNLGLNQVKLDLGIPSANVQLTFNELVPGFFVAPQNVILEMEGAFTNTGGASTTTCGPSGVNCTVTINRGGGNLDFLPVPEPGTLWLLGAGLLGLAGIGRGARARS